MARNVKESLKDIGESVSNAAESTGRILAQGASDMAEGAKEMLGIDKSDSADVGVTGIRDHMPVIASCGRTVGMVDGVEGNQIKLTRKDSPDNQHHFIPLAWVERVDEHVHLNIDSRQVMLNWV